MLNDSIPGMYPMAQALIDAAKEKPLGWNLPDEYQHLVHQHWRTFAAPPYFMHLLLALIYFVLMMISLTGNGTVVWIFSTTKALRTPSNMFILNLAIFDLLMMIEMPLLIINSISERLVGYDTACTVYAALGSLSGIGGAITNAAIAFDRYKTISSPLGGRLSRPQAGIIVALTWFWSLPFTVFPMLKIWGRYIPEGFLTTCSFDYLTDDEDTRVFTACIFVWAYAFPMAMILVFYTRLFMHVRAHETMLKEQAKKMNVKSLCTNQDQKNVEMRIAKAAFTIFFLFVCAWTPYAIVAMIGAFGDRRMLTPLTTMIPALCAKIVSCMDPIVYAISHPRYRAALEEKLPWLGIKSDIAETTSDATTTASE